MIVFLEPHLPIHTALNLLKSKCTILSHYHCPSTTKRWPLYKLLPSWTWSWLSPLTKIDLGSFCFFHLVKTLKQQSIFLTTHLQASCILSFITSYSCFCGNSSSLKCKYSMYFLQSFAQVLTASSNHIDFSSRFCGDQEFGL